MGQPRKRDKYEAAELLGPLVWPLVQGKARVYGPGAGNPATTGVTISYMFKNVAYISTEQYELLRTQVLLPFEQEYLSPARMTVLYLEGLEKVAKDRILEVFENE